MTFWGWDTEFYIPPPGRSFGKLVCGQWADATSEHIALAPDAVRWFGDAIRRGDHLAGVHISVDIVGPAAVEPDLLADIFKAGDAGQFHDCALLEGLHDTALGGVRKKDQGELKRYSMAVLMQRHFGVDISAEKTAATRFSYAKLDGIPIDRWPSDAVVYAKSDARRSFDIRAKQRTHKNKHDEPAQVRAAIAIALMCAWGFRTDAAYLTHLEGQVEGAWNAMREEFGRVGIYRPNGSRDTKALQARIMKAYSGNPPMTSKSARFPRGQISTDRDTLLDSGDPALEKLGNAGKNDKRKTVYLPALKKGIHVPVISNFNELVNTGRVSSDWQQLPQKGGIREAIVSRGHLERLQGHEPDDDTVLFSGDYAGLELRTMVQRAINVTGSSKMGELMRTGIDVHSYFGKNLLRIPYEEFNAEKKGKYKSIRDVAKIGNFGLGGGAEGFALAYGAKAKDDIRIGVSMGREKLEDCGKERRRGRIGKKFKMVCAVCVEAAEWIVQNWLETFPEQRKLREIASRLTQGGRTPDVVIFGSNRIRGGCSYTKWLNTPFQGAGGDGCKAAMWAVAKEAYSDKRSVLYHAKARTFLNVHDELLAEMRLRLAHEAAYRICEIAVREMNKVTPDATNEMEPSIMRRLFKAAEPAFDKQKRLKCWWPRDWAWAPDQEIMRRDQEC